MNQQRINNCQSHAYICMYVCNVMYCKPYAKQSPHKLSIGACKKMPCERMVFSGIYCVLQMLLLLL